MLAPSTAISNVTWTVSQVEEMLPRVRVEILDGVLDTVATPAWPRGPVVDNLHAILRPWFRQHQLGRVLGARSGAYLNELNYPDPDLGGDVVTPEVSPGWNSR